MARRIRAHDWAATPLGPLAAWPQSLRTAVDVCLGSTFPSALLWGAELTILHNDAYVPVLGAAFPGALGHPAPDALADRWPALGPAVAGVLATGAGVGVPDHVETRVRDGASCAAHFAVAFGPVRDGEGRTAGVLITAIETTERARAVEALQQSERRQTFLLALSDALRPLSDADALQATVARLLGEHLGVAWTYYGEYDPGCTTMTVRRDHASGDAPSLVGTHPIASFDILRELQQGRTTVIDDMLTSRWVSDGTRARFGALGMRSFLGAPIVTRGGPLLAALVVADRVPHPWTPAEIALVEEVADRTWAAIERARAEAALRESETKYRTLFESIDEGFCLIEMVDDEAGSTVDYRFLEVNRVYSRLTGQGDPTGKLGSEVAPGTEPSWLHDYDRVARTGEPLRVESFHESSGRWFTAHASRVGGVNSRRVAIVFQEVTERKRAEVTLRESEARLREALEIETVGVVFYDPQGWVLDANEAFLRMTRLARQEVGAGVLHWHDLTAREWWPATHGLFASLAVGKRAAPHEREFLRRGGPSWWGLSAANRLAEGRVVEYVLDVTARRQAEEALRGSEESLQRRVTEATAELRALSQRLLLVQEEERRFLARELHDEIGQVLTGLGFQLGAGTATEDERLAEARRIVAELTNQVRQLSMDLRPAALDSYGLLPALRWHLKRYQQQTGVRVELRAEGVARRFPAPVEIAAYRIVQEALTNVARHAETTDAVVQLFADEAALTVSVRDHGRGFDPRATAGAGGLSGMRERAELLGGTLVIDAAPGQGVVVTAELPIDAPGVDSSDEEADS